MERYSQNFQIKTISWLSALTILACVTISQSRVVSTNLGQVEGETEVFFSKFLKQSGNVDSYRGIPFAKPPIGERRFQPADAIDPWEGVISARSIPPSCPQILQPSSEHLFSEDCLYLNVFVPTEAVSCFIFISHIELQFATTTYPSPLATPPMKMIHDC